MSPPPPPVRFLRLSGGQRLAFTQHGDGEPLVCPAWWVSHLEEDWQDPGFRRLFEGLAQHFMVIRYDRLGSGLSDRGREVATVQAEVATLGALVDHLGLDAFSILAVSCAGPPAVHYAAAYPQRVKQLALYGSFLRGCDVGPVQLKAAIQGLVVAHWGMGSRAITNLFAPDLANDDVSRVCRLHQRSASPQMAALLLDLTFDANAEDVAPAVQAPCLVVHRKSDQTIPIAAGRELAAALPDAQLATLDGDAHVPWLGDVDSVLRVLVDFLGPEASAGAESAKLPTRPTFARAGELWTVAFAQRSAHVRHARGLTDLALMLRHPHQRIHVATLWSGAETAAMGGGDDPVVDDAALASYRRRFEELEASIPAAKARGDVDAATRLEEEQDQLARELRGAVGLGGRKRQFVEPSQRARKAVTARIRASIKKIRAAHPALAQHLSDAVSTGMFCVYEPEDAVDWDVRTDG